MISLAANADIAAGVDLFGKTVSDLQENVTISDDTISGILKYVTDYTGFSGDVSEQSGNYLVLHFDTNIEVDSITVELINGTLGHPVTLDSDGIIVLRIADKDTQSVRVVATKGNDIAVKTFTLDGLTLNES